MPWRNLKTAFFKVLALAVVFLALTHCANHESPLVIPNNSPSSEEPDSPADPSTEGCFVNFNSSIQLKISARPGQESLEVLDANPIPISSIPLEINGTQVILRGDLFPTIILNRLHDSVDLRLSGISGKDGQGPFNPTTGDFSVSGFQLALEVLNKGTEDPFIAGAATIQGVHFTTESVTVTGNFSSLTETGNPFNEEDLSLVLVVGLILPQDFTPLVPLNSIIGGGALTARFEGKLDNLPENCGEARPGAFPPGQEQPSGLKITVQGQLETSLIDFGLSQVRLRRLNGREVLDCTDPSFRPMVSKTVTIRNTGSQDKIIRFNQPVDSDFDSKSPLCNGSSEFLRGSIKLTGNAQCEKVVVAGRDYLIGECTLPADEPESSLSFPLMYLPFNYVSQNPGEIGSLDTADFLIESDENPFLIKLNGRTIPEVRDVFRVSKVSQGSISSREVRHGGNLKVSVGPGEPIPYRQTLVLKNQGEDTWEEIRVEFDEGSGFTAQLPFENRVGPAENALPGTFFFDLLLDPGSANVVNDRVTIRMVRVGSRTEENPAGIETRIILNITATFGLPKLSGEVELQVDFITALIDHPIIDAPLESEDYRARPDFAPAPLKLVFEDTDQPDIKMVKLEGSDFDVLQRAVSIVNRRRFLRIFNARSTIGRNGQRLEENDTPDSCEEPRELNRPYLSGDCSYFYHPIAQHEVGLYDAETGHLTLPGLQLGFQNPYHSDIFGRWPASNPFTDPDYILDVRVDISFTTHRIETKSLIEGGRDLNLVPDSRISNSDLVVENKKLGEGCPQGYLEGARPHLRCYLGAAGRYLKGYEVTNRQDNPQMNDVVLVGIGQFPPGGPNTPLVDLPWFLGDGAGSRIYIALQGRIIKR